jgi:hypothetical protein
MATRGLLCGVEGGAPQEVVVSRTGRSKCPRCIVRCHAAPPSVDALLSMLTSCVERKTEREIHQSWYDYSHGVGGTCWCAMCSM